MKNPLPFNQQFLFITAIIASVVFHAGLIYMLQDMSIQYTSHSRYYSWYQQAAAQHNLSIKQEEEDQRQEQLNQWFQQIQQQSKNSKNPSETVTLKPILPSNTTKPPLINEPQIIAPLNTPLEQNKEHTPLSSKELPVSDFVPAVPLPPAELPPDVSAISLQELNQAIPSDPLLDKEGQGLFTSHPSFINAPTISASDANIAAELGIPSNALPVFTDIPPEVENYQWGDALDDKWQGQNQFDEMSDLPFSEHTQLSNGQLPSLPEEQMMGALTAHEHIQPALNPDLVQDESLTEKLPVPTIAASQDFRIEVEYCAVPKGKGYLFRLTLRPQAEAQFKRIRQHISFLIDRSHSIGKKRYEESKQAVIHALSQLHPHDTFNVLVFDEHAVTFAPQPVEWSPEQVALATTFLQQQPHGGLLASTELYASLDKIIPAEVKDDEINTAILLSDGDTYLSREEQRQTIYQWTKKNQGKVSLFSVASGDRNNLALLELLSTFNRGQLIYAENDSSVGASLAELMSSLQTPIVKNIHLYPVSMHNDTRISLYPANYHLPHLYRDHPLVVYGSINELRDFFLFFQGQYYDKWVDIKQRISFTPSNIDKDVLYREWAIQRANAYYDTYLRTGQLVYLRAAKQLLKPLRIPLAFE